MNKKQGVIALALLTLTFALSCNEPEPQYRAPIDFVKAVASGDVATVQKLFYIEDAGDEQTLKYLIEATKKKDIYAAVSKVAKIGYGTLKGDIDPKDLPYGVKAVMQVDLDFSFCTVEVETIVNSQPRREIKICSFDDEAGPYKIEYEED